MEAQDQIEKFREFIESHYKSKLYDLVRKGKKSLVMSFSDVMEFSHELAEGLLDDPENVLRSAELAAEQFELGEEKISIRVRIRDLPSTQKVKISEIRSEHLGKFLAVEGIVRQASDVRPQVTNAKFECPGCGNTISILQIDTKFKEPSRCTCGWRGKFRLLSKDLIDVQHLKIEESPEGLDGGQQPKRISVFLKEDLVEPTMERRTTPGSKIVINGIVKEIPILLKTGVQSLRYDLIFEANNLESVQEDFGDIDLTAEDEEKIVKFAKDPDIFYKFVNSVAPSIYGHERIKEALILQLFGGVRKEKPDKTVTRGDVHVLLVGDPGCIAGDSQVALFYKGMDQIKNLGEEHMHPINEIVTKIRRDKYDKGYDFATVFQKYKNQPVLRVVTETGKEAVCTYNQPFLTKDGWRRADEIIFGTKIRVMPKIPNNIKKLARTGFVPVEKKFGKLKETIIPEFFTEELASLCGYIVGDGNIHPNGYRITCYVNDEETDLMEHIRWLCKSAFNVEPAYFVRQANEQIKTIDDGNGLLRQIISTQNMHILEINSRQVASCLSFLVNKRVPQQIFQSPKTVIAKFLAWLFEADGCAFGNGRGRTAIQLKSRTKGLLRDVQLLLLYFGIHSRIGEDNLYIRRAHDMELFIKYISFVSKKKREKLDEVLSIIRLRDYTHKRKKFQRWERIASVEPFGIMDVYDFEVPVSKRFIANGIVCHNSGKSQLLQFISKVAPKARFVSGKGASSAGITASVVKDEFLKGWALEAGALVLAHKGIAVIDELDKMTQEDTAALHSAMEQQIISISKANIQATLNSQTTLLAAANPKFGRFDPYTPLATQIELPSTLINRFDLIFPVRDIPDVERDEKIALHVLESSHKEETYQTEVTADFLKKYIAYTKQKIRPKMTKEAINEIKDFYVKLRNSGKANEGGIRAIPISARQLEGLIRLSEASAKLRLDKSVNKDDAKRAIDLVTYCLNKVGLDPETGQIDIDRISTGISASTRSKIISVREIISEFDARGLKQIPMAEIVNSASQKGIEANKVEEAIDQLKKSGDIFEPKRGFISKVG